MSKVAREIALRVNRSSHRYFWCHYWRNGSWFLWFIHVFLWL